MWLNYTYLNKYFSIIGLIVIKHIVKQKLFFHTHNINKNCQYKKSNRRNNYKFYIKFIFSTHFKKHSLFTSNKFFIFHLIKNPDNNNNSFYNYDINYRCCFQFLFFF